MRQEKQLLLKANSEIVDDIGPFIFTLEQSKPRGRFWEEGKQWEVG